MVDWVGCGRIKRFRSFDFFGSPNGPIKYVIEYDDEEEYKRKCQEIMDCIAAGKIWKEGASGATKNARGRDDIFED